MVYEVKVLTANFEKLHSVSKTDKAEEENRLSWY